MSPAFGFSAGDFVSAVQLIAKIVKALDDTRGASKEYRHLLDQLEGLKGVCQQLDALTSIPNGSPAVQGLLTSQSASLLAHLDDALKTISRFDSKLGKTAPPKWFRGAARKTQWAVAFTRDVERLREELAVQLGTISVLLGAEQRHATQTLQTVFDTSNTAVQTKVAAISQQMTPHLDNARLQDQAMKSMLQSMAELQLGQQRLENLFSANRQPHNQISFPSIDNHRIELQTTVSWLFDLIGTQNTSIRDITHRTVQGAGAVSQATARSAIDGLTVLGLYLSIILKQIFYGLLLTFISMRRLASQIPNTVGLFRRNCIMLTDLLGQKHNLPYEYFRSWKVLNAFLQYSSQGTPAYATIMRGDYLLIDSWMHNVEFSDGTWEETIVAGQEITMSALVKVNQMSQRRCPVLGCGGAMESVTSSQAANCSLCDRKFVIEVDMWRDRETELPSVLAVAEDGTAKFTEEKTALDDDLRYFKLIHVSISSTPLAHHGISSLAREGIGAARARLMLLAARKCDVELKSLMLEQSRLKLADNVAPLLQHKRYAASKALQMRLQQINLADKKLEMESKRVYSQQHALEVDIKSIQRLIDWIQDMKMME